MKKILKRLNKKEWAMILLSTLFICLGVWMDLRTPSYMSKITELLQTPGTEVADIWDPGSKMMLFSFGSFIMAICVGFLAAQTAASYTSRLRAGIFDQVLTLSDSEVKAFSVPSLLTRTTNDLTQLQIFITMAMQVVTKGPIMAGWAMTKIWGKSTEWTIAIGVAVVIILIMLAILSLLAFPRQKEVQVLTDGLNQTMRETLSGIRVVRAYNAEDYQNEKFEKQNKRLTQLNLFINRIMSLMNPVMTVVSSGLTLVIYWIGAYLIKNVPITTTDMAQARADVKERVSIFSDMIVFSSYGMQVVIGFMMMVAIFIILPRAIVSANRINEVLDVVPALSYPNERKLEESGEGNISVNNVTFKYTDITEPVIKDISFEAHSGDTVAFIGSTGSGKSTLVKLIARLSDVSQGEIFINGQAITDFSHDDLNEIIGYIPQSAVLFSGTIRSNLMFGHSKESPLSDEDMWAALELAQAKDFVAALPEGLDAPVAQGGRNFSGGQKQRLAIARALARKPEILIFDDSFSALDYKTDRILREQLADKTHHMTKLIVAQRISTIMDANQIIVLEAGEVVGQGTHKELLATNKVYQEIAYSQLSKEELENDK